jgi:hypothetical protein
VALIDISAGEAAKMQSVSEKKIRGRKIVARKALESAITKAVKNCPECETFVGVWVETCAKQSGEDTNWAIKGVQFGKADREKCGCALTAVVKRAQQEFELHT